MYIIPIWCSKVFQQSAYFILYVAMSLYVINKIYFDVILQLILTELNLWVKLTMSYVLCTLIESQFISTYSTAYNYCE